MLAILDSLWWCLHVHTCSVLTYLTNATSSDITAPLSCVSQSPWRCANEFAALLVRHFLPRAPKILLITPAKTVGLEAGSWRLVLPHDALH